MQKLTRAIKRLFWPPEKRTNPLEDIVTQLKTMNEYLKQIAQGGK